MNQRRKNKTDSLNITENDDILIKIRDFSSKMIKLESEILQINKMIEHFEVIKEISFTKFEEKPFETREQYFKRRNIFFEEQYEKALRVKKIHDDQKRVLQITESVKKITTDLFEMFEPFKDKTFNEMNMLIDEIKNLEEEFKPDLKQNKYHKREFKSLYFETNEYRARRKKYKEEKMKKREEENENRRIEKQKELKEFFDEKQFNKVEEWTTLEFDKVIFDSTQHNCEIKNSEFFDKIKDKHDLIFLAKTSGNGIFGNYVSSTISKEEEYIFDSSAFIFNFKNKDHQLTKMDIPKKAMKMTDKINNKEKMVLRGVCAFKVFNKDNKYLYEVGKGDIKINKGNLKKNKVDGGYKPNIYSEMKNEQQQEKQLEKLKIERIVVIQMKENEFDLKKKQKRMHLSQTERETIEKWTGKSIGNILYDNYGLKTNGKDEYKYKKIERKEIEKSIDKKGKLLFLIKTQSGNDI